MMWGTARGARYIHQEPTDNAQEISVALTAATAVTLPPAVSDVTAKGSTKTAPLNWYWSMVVGPTEHVRPG